MQQNEKLESYKFAIDTPSKLFIKFMKKYFNLYKYRNQSHGYVIYDRLFEDEQVKLKLGVNKRFKNFGF